MKVAIYARVSSKAQAERHTIQSQLRELRRYVAAQEWTVTGEYIDDGRTAKTGHLEKRLAFAALVKDAEAGKFEMVAVVDIDRLTRTEDMTERAIILGPFQRLGIDIVTPASGRLDLRTLFGELQATMFAMFAAAENRKRSSATLAGKARAAAENRSPGALPPMGLHYDRMAGEWAIVEEHAALVRQLFERVAAGTSCQKLDREMRQRGVAAVRVGTWPRGRTYKMIMQPAYRGEWVVSKGRGHVVRVPAIVPDELWRAANAQLGINKKIGLRKTRHFYLLESLGRCGLCGSRIIINSHNGVSPSTYACAQRARPVAGMPRCTLRHWPTAATDEAVWDELLREILTPGRLERALARQSGQEAADAQAWQDDLRAAKERLAKLQRAEEGILARFRNGLISDGAFDAELASAAEKRRFLENQVKAAHKAATAHEAASDVARDFGGRLSEVRKTVRAAEPDERQRLIRAACVGERVIFGLEGVRASIAVPVAGHVSSLRRASSREAHETKAPNVLRFELVARVA